MATAMAGMLYLIAGCGHDAATAPIAVVQVATPDTADDGVCGPSHRDAAIQRAAMVAEHLRPGLLDLRHPGACFSRCTLPGLSADTVRCWTIIFPTRTSVILAAQPDHSANATPPFSSPTYMPENARPNLRTTNAAAPAPAAKPPTGMTRFVYPGQNGSGESASPAEEHGLGAELPQGMAQGTPRMASNGGAPMIAPSPTETHTSPPLAITSPGPPPGMRERQGVSPSAVQLATTYAPPPFIVFVLVDGRTVTAHVAH